MRPSEGGHVEVRPVRRVREAMSIRRPRSGKTGGRQGSFCEETSLMCRYCVEHGEGKEWFAAARNFAAGHMSDVARTEATRAFLRTLHGQRPALTATTLRYAMCFGLYYEMMKLPLVSRVLRRFSNRFWQEHHFGQVLTLNEAERAISAAGHVTMLTCWCRKQAVGQEERSCMGLGAWGEFVSRELPFDRRQEVSVAEAQGIVERYHRDGCYQSIWTLRTPFLAAICNCNDRVCFGRYVQRGLGAEQVLVPGHMRIRIESERCQGCGECVAVCPFGALRVNGRRRGAKAGLRGPCYGCGLCLSRCPAQAIVRAELDARH
ncbi:MAG: ferredoxin family protein, partial [Planctomycetes bacterium]|nr:ferredoxin family protein [Planctomycetota bacterium]